MTDELDQIPEKELIEEFFSRYDGESLLSEFQEGIPFGRESALQIIELENLSIKVLNETRVIEISPNELIREYKS